MSKNCGLFAISGARARDSLRGSAWSMARNCGLFTVLDVRARPSAGIGVVDVQKLGLVTMLDLRGLFTISGVHATLCGDLRARCQKAVDSLNTMSWARDVRGR